MDAMEIIKRKESLIGELENINEELIISVSSYKEIQSKLWLDTDWAEAVGKAKPTVDEKKAYIALKSQTHRLERDMVKYRKEVVLKKMELCDDLLRVCNE